MCEKRARKIVKKGSHVTRLREARRLQRIQRMTPSPAVEDPTPGQLPQLSAIDKALQNKIILELAWKTVALMHKNKLIQQKILALQKETSEFVASIINSPDNRQRYIEYVKTQADGVPIMQDYASSHSTASFSSSSSTYSPSSPEMSPAPMSPEWQPEPQTLPLQENLLFKTKSEF